MSLPDCKVCKDNGYYQDYAGGQVFRAKCDCIAGLRVRWVEYEAVKDLTNPWTGQPLAKPPPPLPEDE